jgi:anti-sigma B factor antagonist
MADHYGFNRRNFIRSAATAGAGEDRQLRPTPLHPIVTTRRADVVVVLGVAGRLTLEEGVATLREQAQQQLAAGEQKILVDLSSCEYVDSVGLGELTTTLIRLQNAGGRFALFGVKKRVRELLRISKLLAVFEIFDDEAHAQAVMSESRT